MVLKIFSIFWLSSATSLRQVQQKWPFIMTRRLRRLWSYRGYGFHQWLVGFRNSGFFQERQPLHHREIMRFQYGSVTVDGYGNGSASTTEDTGSSLGVEFCSGTDPQRNCVIITSPVTGIGSRNGYAVSITGG